MASLKYRSIYVKNKKNKYFLKILHYVIWSKCVPSNQIFFKKFYFVLIFVISG